MDRAYISEERDFFFAKICGEIELNVHHIFSLVENTESPRVRVQNLKICIENIPIMVLVIGLYGWRTL